MYTSVMLLALSGLSAPAEAPTPPAWRTDYGAAQKLAQTQQRPLAIFVGTGKQGWRQVAQGGELGAEAARLLVSRYIPVYLDADTAEGKRLAQAFELSSGVGLVLSDRILRRYVPSGPPDRIDQERGARDRSAR